jgi:hypothetical protein
LIDGVKQWQQRLHYDKTGRLTLASEHRGDNSQLTGKAAYGLRPLCQPLPDAKGQNLKVSHTQVASDDMTLNRNRYAPATGVVYDAGQITQDPKFRWWCADWSS